MGTGIPRRCDRNHDRPAMRYENVTVDIDQHRWYVNIDITKDDGTIDQWVAAGGEEWSGVFWGTREDYNEATGEFE